MPLLFSGGWFLILVLLHFVGDFVLQTHWQAKHKSSDVRALAAHVFTYSLVFFVMFGWEFAAITAVTHFLIDWNTSRLTSLLWRYSAEKRDEQSTHLFFLVIGFDQVLHYIQLVATLTWWVAQQSPV